MNTQGNNPIQREKEVRRHEVLVRRAKSSYRTNIGQS